MEGHGSKRVLVGDPNFSVGRVEELLAETGAVVEASPAPWGGDDVVALLCGPDFEVTTDALDNLPALQIVATPSVGFDHIPIDRANERGIWVCNVPDYCVEEMADGALAFVLALLRSVVPLDRGVRAGGWYEIPHRPIRRIAGTRLGLIGFGRIGRALCTRARALEMEVWAFDPFVSASDMSADGARPAALDDLLAACDAISLHLPLTEETRDLIGEREIALMRRRSVLVNVSRGGLIDHAALVRALENGHLGGAALDALPVEPPTAEAPAPEAATLIVTPHALWYSPEAEEAAYTAPVLAVRAVLEGRSPDGAVAGPTAARQASRTS